MFRIAMYGKLPTIGSLGGPGGNFLGFLVDLKISSKKTASPIIAINISLHPIRAGKFLINFKRFVILSLYIKSNNKC